MRKRVAVPVCALTLLAMTPLAGAERLPESHKPHKKRDWKRYSVCREKQLLPVPLGKSHASRREVKTCRKNLLLRARSDTRVSIRYVWPRRLWGEADRVTACEGGPSRRIDAIGDGGHSRSSWQINDLYWRYDKKRMLTNAVYASRFALAIYQRGGWSLWTCRP